MRYLIAGAGGLMVLLGCAFAAIDLSRGEQLSSISTVALITGLLVGVGGLHVELTKLFIALERISEEHEKRRQAQRREREADQQRQEAARREKITREEQQKKAQQLLGLKQSLRNLDPDSPTDISNHRAAKTARTMRMFAWLSLLGGIGGGLASATSKATEEGILGIPAGMFVWLLLLGFASLIETLTEACVLLRRLDDRDALRGNEKPSEPSASPRAV